MPRARETALVFLMSLAAVSGGGRMEPPPNFPGPDVFIPFPGTGGEEDLPDIHGDSDFIAFLPTGTGAGGRRRILAPGVDECDDSGEEGMSCEEVDGGGTGTTCVTSILGNRCIPANALVCATGQDCWSPATCYKQPGAARGLCNGCQSDGDCPTAGGSQTSDGGSSSGSRCFVFPQMKTGQCVECVEHGDCSESSQYCGGVRADVGIGRAGAGGFPGPGVSLPSILGTSSFTCRDKLPAGHMCISDHECISARCDPLTFIIGPRVCMDTDNTRSRDNTSE